jgi:hypothetical protein
MSDEAWCYLALVTGLVVLLVITMAVLRAPSSRMYKTPAEVRQDWRSCVSRGERMLAILTLTLQLIAGGILAFLAAIVGAVISMSLSLCGTSPETVDKILDFLRDLLDVPPRRATP